MQYKRITLATNMRITGAYFATAAVAEKINQRGIELHDILEVFRAKPLVHVGGRDRYGNKKYFAWGQNQAGRYLFIVFVAEPGGQARLISARDMTKREKKRHTRS